MKQIRTVDALGHILCHDITQIVKDVTKEVAFRKGHVVREEDIPVLLSLGKDHLYIWEMQPGMRHENDAAEILCELCMGERIDRSSRAKEGKIDLFAATDGLFCVDVEALAAVNGLEDIVIASRHNCVPVKSGEKLAGMRVIPLVIHEDKLEEARRAAGNVPLMQVRPYRPLQVGIVTTGNEVYHGRIEDTFTPVIRGKLAEYGLIECGHHILPDDKEQIADAIRSLLDSGAEMILCTGGMSVDPDDVTPGAIRASGAEVVSYGAPVLPGSMFLMAYMPDGTPIMGLPGCVMYTKTTVFDLILPQVAAGLVITKEQLARMGHGGLCLGCKPCIYPLCPFGKGV